MSAIRTLLRMDDTVTARERAAVTAAVEAVKAAHDAGPALAVAATEGAWLKGREVCKMLRIDRSTLSRWCAGGRLVARKRGTKLWYVSAESVRKCLLGVQAEDEEQQPDRNQPEEGVG